MVSRKAAGAAAAPAEQDVYRQEIWNRYRGISLNESSNGKTGSWISAVPYLNQPSTPWL